MRLCVSVFVHRAENSRISSPWCHQSEKKHASCKILLKSMARKKAGVFFMTIYTDLSKLNGAFFSIKNKWDVRSYPQLFPNVRLAAAPVNIITVRFHILSSSISQLSERCEWCGLGENQSFDKVTLLPDAAVTSAAPCEGTSGNITFIYNCTIHFKLFVQSWMCKGWVCLQGNNKR